MTKVLKGREKQAIFRVGKFGIEQVPLNVVVGEIKLVTTGKDKGTERLSNKSFHGSYEEALKELLRRGIKYHMREGDVTLIKGVIDSIEEAKNEILDALHAL